MHGPRSPDDEDPCAGKGCGFVNHHPSCSFYKEPPPPVDPAVEDLVWVNCFGCDKRVRFGEVRDTLLCKKCQRKNHL